MYVDNFVYPAGATPLDLDEAAGLIPGHISTQSQLNEWEHMNILQVEQWLARQRFHDLSVLDADFIKKLHHRMFGKTWRWAGQFRKTNKNIGVEWLFVPMDLKLLIDDARYQLEHAVYSIDEWAVRFHHRLVTIHLFANGNGRHARMMSDILLLSQKHKRFTWGSVKSLVDVSVTRAQYIHALRAADQKNYLPLMDFVRS